MIGAMASMLALPLALFPSPHSFSVIPGRAEGANPESSYLRRACFWIPGSLATLAPRNDREKIKGPA
jgi:hypothetical protein